LDAAGAVAVLTVIGPAQVAGRILVRAFTAEGPVRPLGSAIMIVFPIVVMGLALTPPKVILLAAVAAFYSAANGMITIVRGMAVPEMVKRESYGAVNGSLVGPMNVMSALAPLWGGTAVTGEQRLRGLFSPPVSRDRSRCGQGSGLRLLSRDKSMPWT